MSSGGPARAPRGRARTIARTLATEALLAAVAPVTATVTVAALLRRAVVGVPARARAARPRTVLLSGGKMTKALTLARAFHAAGHRVVLVESAAHRFTGHRFSRAVSAFHVVPPAPDPGYPAALLDVVRAEGVDVYVPVCSPDSSRYDALAKPVLEPYCRVLHGDAAAVDEVDDKAAFAAAAGRTGLGVPATHRVASAEQVAAVERPTGGPDYVLKSIAYDPVHRLDLTPVPRGDRAEVLAFARARPISPRSPWIVQELVAGREYCTHGTAADGRLRVYCCCASSAFQVNYAAVEKPEIERWVRRFVADRGLTGQYSFDFIETPQGRLVALECNPRTHSAITLFADQPEALARAYLDDDPQAPVLRPTPGRRPTHWLYHELWRLLTGPRRRERWRTIRAGTDAVFDASDPLPFLLLHHLHIPWLLARTLGHGGDWVRIDFNIGKLVEPAGD